MRNYHECFTIFFLGRWDFRGERAYVAKISKLLVMVGFVDTRTCV